MHHAVSCVPMSSQHMMSLGWGTAVPTLFFGRNVDVFVLKNKSNNRTASFFDNVDNVDNICKRLDVGGTFFCFAPRRNALFVEVEKKPPRPSEGHVSWNLVRHRLIPCNLEKFVGFMKLWNCVLFWILCFVGHILCWVFFLSLLLALLGMCIRLPL